MVLLSGIILGLIVRYRKAMAAQISLPRHNSNAGQPSSTFTMADSQDTSNTTGKRMPRFFKRLFKFPQMDFEMAVWEMTNIVIAPKKVFRSIRYHQQTKNTWHRPDPSFTYLLSFFLTLTSIAWGLAYADGFGRTLRLVLVFVFGHFIGLSLVVATLAYFLVGRLLGPGIKGLPGRRRQGLFAAETGRAGGAGNVAAGEQLEFGYCFDVAIRAFFPVWVFLYVVQFLLMPVVSQEYWVSLFFGNLLYLVAYGYYAVITFLGYNALPFLHHTELLLAPVPIISILFIASLFGFNMPRHLAPVLWAGAQLRKGV